MTILIGCILRLLPYLEKMGSALTNAFWLMDMHSIEHKPKDIKLQNQFTLGRL
jgi:hypothetical protein